jgi:hypothetical protein
MPFYLINMLIPAHVGHQECSANDTDQNPHAAKPGLEEIKASSSQRFINQMGSQRQETPELQLSIQLFLNVKRMCQQF